MTDLITHKRACRDAARLARRTAHGIGLDKAANAQLLNFLKDGGKDQIVAGYMPIGSEASPLGAMSKLHARGISIAVPVVVAKAQPLEFHRWEPDAHMQEGAFGVLEPQESAKVIPDIVITPLLAFDAQGYRLGYGGGFYDRTIAKLKANGTRFLGFAYSEQELMLIPRDQYDQPLEAVITEKGVMQF